MAVVIGFKDERVKANDQLDFSVNKIGGLPDWLSSFKGNLHPKCKLCNQLLYQIVQIYCPLVGSTYHRTLYIFGCCNKQCCNKPESFTVLRCQKLEEKKEKQKPAVSTDSWGTNEWFDDEECSADFVPEDTATKENTTLESIRTSMDTITQALSDHLVLTIDPVIPPEFVSYYLYAMEEKDTVTGESAVDYEMKLYEEYVAREGELPEMPENSHDRPVKSGKQKGSGRKERRQQDFGDGYEKVKVKHGDQVFYQFQKRIVHCPEQCLRYEWKGDPLLLSSISQVTPPIDRTPPCPRCKSPRVFEMQLMPNLVTCLHQSVESGKNQDFDNCAHSNGCSTGGETPATEYGGGSLDFGCLYIYTCSQSCWEDTDVIFEEHIALQPDPEANVLM